MSMPFFPSREYGDDVYTVHLPDKIIVLIGTAHLSQYSTDLVKLVIEEERPDTVCVELDEKRYQALSKRQSWQNLDLKQLIRDKQLPTLLVNLLLASYQKKLGGQMGTVPGAELLAAAQTAEALNIPVTLCDRDVRVTLRRAWRNTPFWQKGYLLGAMLASFFEKQELDEEKLTEMRKKDALAQLIDELGASLPQAKRVLIDERDVFMAERIKHAEGSRIVAVVGAGHVRGIGQAIHTDNSARLEELNIVRPIPSLVKFLAWFIPLVILFSLATIGFRHGLHEFNANILYWTLAHGIPAALGATIAGAHPLTILAAFAGAPITSLTPVIGAGYVCAFVQVLVRPPIVLEFEEVTKDMGSFTGWWRNKLLRIFLIFFLTSLGSSLGTFLGGYRIATSLFS